MEIDKTGLRVYMLLNISNSFTIRSAAVAQSGRATDLNRYPIKVDAVNQLVDGSNPSGGAKTTRPLESLLKALMMMGISCMLF